MKMIVTYEVEMSMPGAEHLKDVEIEAVAEALHGILDDYEDGRYDLARETLTALTHGRLFNAVYRALADKLYARYGNRLMKVRERCHASIASLIAQKRLTGLSSHSYVRNVRVDYKKSNS